MRPLTPSAAEPMEARQPCLYRREKGREGIAWRPVVLTGIGLTGSMPATHDAADKTGSGRAPDSVGREALVISDAFPRLTRTSTGCGRPACLVVALSRRRMCCGCSDEYMTRRTCLSCKAVNPKKLLPAPPWKKLAQSPLLVADHLSTINTENRPRTAPFSRRRNF